MPNLVPKCVKGKKTQNKNQITVTAVQFGDYQYIQLYLMQL